MTSGARTVLDLVRASTDYLARHGVASPRLDAETLFADLVGASRLDLYVRFDMPVDDATRDRYRERIVARARGAPTSHVLGRREFYGRSFKVDRRALAPRPETEHLVDAGLEFLRARRDVPGAGARPRVLEIGVGSGCVVASLAAEFPDAAYVGVDVSEDALRLAAENVAVVAPGADVALRRGDLFDACGADERFDLVVSNPPYVADDEWDDLPREVRDFDPPLALRSGPDPTSFLTRISDAAPPHLAATARIALEGGAGLAAFAEGRRARFPGAAVRVANDLARRPRVVVIDFRGA